MSVDHIDFRGKIDLIVPNKIERKSYEEGIDGMGWLGWP